MCALGADNLFEQARLVETLLGPVMDAIHQLEADQPMLPFMHSLLKRIREHFVEFEDDHPDLAHGEKPVR